MSAERLFIERRKKVMIDLNIAPLIDVVFQLLLFFALTSYFVANPGIEVSLPKANSAVTVQRNNIEIYITGSNAIYCNAAKVELLALKEMLSTLSASSKTVILKADKSVQLGMVVQVIDIVKQTQVKDLVIATSMEENNASQK
ncbi:MAG: biopolymer transporter ExbD [Spirochaetota bacterium]